MPKKSESHNSDTAPESSDWGESRKGCEKLSPYVSIVSSSDNKSASSSDSSSWSGCTAKSGSCSCNECCKKKSSSSSLSKSKKKGKCRDRCGKGSYCFEESDSSSDCSSSESESSEPCRWSKVCNSGDSKSKDCSTSTSTSSTCTKSSSSTCSCSSCSKSSWSSSSSSRSSCSSDSSSSSSCSSDSSSRSSCSSSSSSCDSSSSDKVERVYVVTLVDKKMHPWAGRICDTGFAYAIDGKHGKRIHLKRGKTYHFKIEVDLKVNHPEPFYFTADPAGGQVGDMAEHSHDPMPLPGVPAPMGNGVYVLKVTNDMPKMFYYQSRQSKFLGGMVFVHG